MSSWRSIAIFGLLLITACGHVPDKLSGTQHYDSIGVLPTYQPVLSKSTPPGFFDFATVEHQELDFRLNELVANRITKALGAGHRMVDLSAFAPACIEASKARSGGERRIFGDSRPQATDVVRSLVGAQALDAYIIIEGGIGVYQRREGPPIAQIVTAQGYNLGVDVYISIIDGHTFEIVASSGMNLAKRDIPEAWFVAPNEHVNEIQEAIVNLLNVNIGPALLNLGLLR